MTDESILALEHAQLDGRDVVRVAGEVDLTNVDQVQEALLATRSQVVILDLTGLYFLDSAGIRAVDASYGALVREGRALKIVAAPDSRAAWTFRIAGFPSDLVFESVEAVETASATPTPGD